VFLLLIAQGLVVTPTCAPRRCWGLNRGRGRAAPRLGQLAEGKDKPSPAAPNSAVACGPNRARMESKCFWYSPAVVVDHCAPSGGATPLMFGYGMDRRCFTSAFALPVTPPLLVL